MAQQNHFSSSSDDGNGNGPVQLSSEEAAALRRCVNCFQLIAVDIVLNASLSPFIIEVTCQPNMQEGVREEAAVAGKVKKQVLADMLGLLTANTPVVTDVAEALEEVIGENSVGVMGASCLISHEVCLSRDDLNYLLQARREDLNKGGFNKLYPAIGTESQKELIDELSQKIVSNSVHNDLSFHKTADLHPLLMAMERFYYRHIVDANYEDSPALSSAVKGNSLYSSLATESRGQQAASHERNARISAVPDSISSIKSTPAATSSPSSSSTDCSDGKNGRRT